jgi:uncharacterized protein involved in exopolysaccharide biosynthesis
MNPYSRLAGLLNVAFKHLWTVLIAFVCTTTVAGVFILSREPVYRANASLLVKLGRAQMYVPEVGDSRAVLNRDRESVINAEIEILRSKGLLRTTIERVGLKRLYPGLLEGRTPEKALERAALAFLKNVSTMGVEDSSVIRVAFEHEDPKLAAEAVNTLIELYLDKHLEIFSTAGSFGFLEGKVTSYEEQLRGAEDALAEFKMSQLTLSIGEEAESLLGSRARLSDDLEATEWRLMELDERIRTLESQVAGQPSEVELYSEERTDVLERARAQLLELRLEEQELLTKYVESSRLVVSVRESISLVEEFLREAQWRGAGLVRFGPNELLASLIEQVIAARAERSSLEVRESMLREALAINDADLRDMAARERTMRRLERDLANSEEAYHAYVAKLEETRISSEMDLQKLTNVSVVQEALVPVKARGVARVQGLVVAIFMGLATGVGLAFLAEHLHQGLNSPDSAERRLGIPVLAVLPDANSARSRAVFAASGARRQAEARQRAGLEPKDAPRVAEHEMVALAHVIDAELPGQPGRGRVLRFVGTREGEGTSTVVRAFARAASKRVGRTVLVLTAQDGGDEAEEASDSVIGEAAPTGQDEAGSRLVFGPAPSVPDLPDVLNGMRDSFDLILLDSAPFSLSQDALAASKVVDGVLLVMRAEQTPWPEFETAVRRFRLVSAHIVGGILNQYRSYVPRWVQRLR